MTVADAVNVEEALALIDRGLGQLHSRELMSSNEVADLLLDVRVLLATASVEEADADTQEPIAVS